MAWSVFEPPVRLQYVTVHEWENGPFAAFYTFLKLFTLPQGYGNSICYNNLCSVAKIWHRMCVPPMKMSSEKTCLIATIVIEEKSPYTTQLCSCYMSQDIATPTNQQRSAVLSSAASFCPLCHPNWEVHSWSWVENMFLQALFLKGARTYCITNEPMPSSTVAMNYFS